MFDADEEGTLRELGLGCRGSQSVSCGEEVQFGQERQARRAYSRSGSLSAESDQIWILSVRRARHDVGGGPVRYALSRVDDIPDSARFTPVSDIRDQRLLLCKSVRTVRDLRKPGEMSLRVL